MPLKILQVFNQYLDPGGEELWVDRMNTMGTSEVEIDDLRFYSRLWKTRGAPNFFRQAMLLGNNREARHTLRNAIQSAKPDALVFHNVIPVGSLGLYDEAKLHGIPIIQYIHNFRPFSPSGTLWYRGSVHAGALHGNMLAEVMHSAWERSFTRTALLALHLKYALKNGLLERIDHWIAVSEFMREKFIDAGIAERRITALRHCWQPEPVAEPSEEADYYLFLGRLVSEKGLIPLLDAWQILEKKLGPSTPRLLIAGNGPLEREIHRRSSLMKHVELLGFVSGGQKQSLIRGARAILAPSLWWEPLGLIVYEAYENQRPVIAARSGGLVETVQDNQTGFLFGTGNPESLVEAVLKAEALGKDGRCSQGLAGRQWLETNASLGDWQNEFQRIMEHTIQHAPASR